MPRKTAKKLPFKELNTKLGADELIKRLKACLKYFEECESLNDTDPQELLNITNTLISDSIKTHKQREVPLLASCVLVCIVRLFSEDNLPFGDEQTKSIYKLFIAQLIVLENPSSSLFNFSYRLLENLSTLQVFNNALEIEATEIIPELFDTILSIVNVKQSSHVHSLLMGLMIDIIQESKTGLPMEAFNSIVKCIIEPEKSENPVTYDFVSALIKKASLNLEHYVHVFFTMSLSDESGPATVLADHLYDIIQSLHEIDSSVLLSVLPRLETILQSTNEVERTKVTKMLAKMFGSKNSQLACENRLLWQSFLGRFQDISSDIRCECVTMSKYFLVYHPNMRESVSEKLMQRLMDTEEKVRVAAVKTITDVALEDITALTDQVFCSLRDRMRDRKCFVRKVTVQSLCRVYRHFMAHDSLTVVESDMIEWIPNKLFHCLFQKIREDSLIITRAFLSCVVPVSLEPKEKMERLLDVFNSLDENAVRAFEDFMKRRKQLRKLLIELVEIHDDDKLMDAERKKLLLTKSVAINAFVPDPSKWSLDHITKDFVPLLPEMSQLLLDCIDVTKTYSVLMKAKSDILSKFTSSQSPTTETIKSILDMCSPILMDKECVKELVGRVTKELWDPSLGETEDMEEKEQIKCKNGVTLIKMLCALEPSWFEVEDTLTDILTILRHKDHDIVENSVISLTNVGKGVSQWSTVSGSLQPILVNLVTKGNPRVAKLSVRCLHSVYEKTDMVVDKLMRNLLKDLTIGSSKLLTTLSSLSQIARFYSRKFCSKHQEVVYDFALPKILSAGNKSLKRKHSNLWCDKTDLQHDVKLKIACLKLLVSWMIGLHNDTKNKKEKDQHIDKIIEILTETIESNGNKNYDNTMSPCGMSHMRLTAGSCILKLLRLAGCAQSISIHHHQMMLKLITDPCAEVREIFITKLYDGLRLLVLPLSCLSLFCMASDASVPDTLPKTKLKEMVSIIIKQHREYYSAMKRKSNPPDTYQTVQTLPEYSLPFAIYLLAHHPSFSRTDVNALDTFREHLWFFLEPFVCKTDNYGFIQKMADDIKQSVCTQDPKDEEMNMRLYTVCDLTMALLNHKKSVISLGEFQGEVILPRKLYTKKRSKPNSTKYLPRDYVLYADREYKGNEPFMKSPVKKRKPQQPKKTNDTLTSLEMSDISDTDEATPTKKVSPNKAASSSKRTNSGKKRSPKKQTKIPFVPKKTIITSTPAVSVVKSDPKRNAKRKVLQEENGKSMTLRRSPRKRNTLNISQIERVEESRDLTDIMEDSDNLMELEEQEQGGGEEQERVHEEQERGGGDQESDYEEQESDNEDRDSSPPPAKQLKRDNVKSIHHDVVPLSSSVRVTKALARRGRKKRSK